MKLNRREKAILSLIIREVQDSLVDKKLKSRTTLARDIDEKLDAWVRANDLHPESAGVMNVREFRRWLKNIKREETEGNEKTATHLRRFGHLERQRPADKTTAAPFDQKDLEIARDMLAAGYFQTPRPEDLSLDSLSRKVGLTKPELRPRMRRLMKTGVRRILGVEELTKEDRKAAYQVFMKGRASR